MGDSDMVQALEAALSDSYGENWKVLAGLEKAPAAPEVGPRCKDASLPTVAVLIAPDSTISLLYEQQSRIVRDQHTRVFDFRNGTFPEGASLVGAQVGSCRVCQYLTAR